PFDARVIDGSRKVVVPGLVEAHTSRGTDRPNERLTSVPFVSTFDSINPVEPYFEDSLRQGITTLCVMPGNDTMIGGQGCVVRPTGVTVESMMVVKNVGLKISLRPRAGVSKMAHIAALRKELAEAADLAKDKKADPDPRREPMSRLLKGLIPAFVYCPTASDVHRAIELAESAGFKIKLVLGRDGWKASSEIAMKGLEAILDPDLEYWETDEELHDEVRRCGAVAPAKAGVKIAFQTDAASSGTNYLWYQAATAVKNGLGRAEALRAITLAPAEILGLGSRLGSIEKGKDANLVVLTGDPLDAQTWVDTVLIEGRIVYERSKDEKLRRILEGKK
ncbi:MAG TPA: amidohydrolase family protein, partial [Planctomycetota bacterium]|nr:amidohydrolase family protein [Planctomycetota bacterium]